MKNTKEYLYKIKQDLEEKMNDISLDFVGDYDIEGDYYISDLFMEASDNALSVYYSDQYKYYDDDPIASENALLELYDSESIADIIKHEGLYNLCCKAGVCRMYNENYNNLSEDEESIKQLLIIRYLIKNDIFTLSEDEINDLIEEATGRDIDRTSDLLDLINEHLENNEESEK